MGEKSTNQEKIGRLKLNLKKIHVSVNNALKPSTDPSKVRLWLILQDNKWLEAEAWRGTMSLFDLKITLNVSKITQKNGQNLLKMGEKRAIFSKRPFKRACPLKTGDFSTLG